MSLIFAQCSEFANMNQAGGDRYEGWVNLALVGAKLHSRKHSFKKSVSLPIVTGNSHPEY